MYQNANDSYCVKRYRKEEQKQYQQQDIIKYEEGLSIEVRVHICNTWLPIFCVILVEGENIYVVDKFGGYLYSDEVGDPLCEYINEIINKYSPPG
jgi:hypothetical protein